MTPTEVRADIDDRHRFADEHDLTVGTRRPCRIDVKSRTLRFTGIHDYDYSTAFVDTVSGWETKTRKPKAIVLISQHTKAMLVASADDSRHWFRQRRRDHKRQIDDDYYMVRTERLRTFEALVGYLQRRETAP